MAHHLSPAMRHLSLVLASGLLAVAFAAPVSAQTAAVPTAPVAADSVVVLAQGAFVDKGGQTTHGSYRIERTAAGLRLVLSDDFSTTDGPDLHVILTPTTVADAGNRNVVIEGVTEIVAPLASQRGGQTYALREGLDLAAFETVAIHCIRYKHLYGAAPLR